MPILQAVKNRIATIAAASPTPARIATFLAANNIVAIPNSDTDGILQRYLVSQGIDVTNQYVRGYEYLTSADNDIFKMPRCVSIFIYLFNQRRYPQLIEGGA